jgi:hypothetical protein
MRVVIQWEVLKEDFTVTEEFGIKHNLTETHNRWRNTQLFSWKHEQVYDVLDKHLFMLFVLKHSIKFERVDEYFA